MSADLRSHIAIVTAALEAGWVWRNGPLECPVCAAQIHPESVAIHDDWHKSA